MKYRIVPTPATEEMRTAGGRACADERGNPDPGHAEYVYDAVLSAYPNPLDDEELRRLIHRAIADAIMDNPEIPATAATEAVLALLDGR